jgi:hypothetical protein
MQSPHADKIAFKDARRCGVAAAKSQPRSEVYIIAMDRTAPLGLAVGGAPGFLSRTRATEGLRPLVAELLRCS